MFFLSPHDINLQYICFTHLLCLALHLLITFYFSWWYADDPTLMAEGQEELKSPLLKVRQVKEIAGLKVNIHFTHSIHLPLPLLPSFRVHQFVLYVFLPTAALRLNSSIPSIYRHQFSSVQLLSRVQLFVTPWITARQASLSITNSQSLLKLMPMELVVTSSHLILCHPLLLLPPVPPSIRVFSNESSLHMRWPKYWSFSFSISPSNEHPGLISFRMDWLDLLAVQGTLKTLHQYKIFLFLFLISLYIIGSRFLLMYDRKPQNSVRQLSFK